ncbi:MAG TPA: primosomal protein N' [Planctomycetes bacterium]|nr:primosomal protein N' [Planctomycetota bacterium]
MTPRARPQAETLFDLGSAEADEPAEPVRGAFCRVAVQRPIRREFTYRIPDPLEERIRVGCRVAVRFAGRRHVGVVVGLEDECSVPSGRIQPVLDLLGDEPVFDAELLELTHWIADRWGASWGETLGAALPASLKRERGTKKVRRIAAVEGIDPAELAKLSDAAPKRHRLLRFLMELGEPIELRDALRRLNLSESPARTLERQGLVRIESVDADVEEPVSSAAERARPAKLSARQNAAIEHIRARIEAREHRTFLLEGVTGSGKTEVYLRGIEEALARGRSAILLVPEIALTPQTVAWFRSRFGDVCVLHSGLTDAQRLESWKRLKRGEVRVVVGARSAIFAPVADLGIVVVDEEHEPSFKQETTPRYHARDVAVERARRAGAVCVLGSATPSLESWTKAGAGEYKRLSLPERVGGGTEPKVHVVDMRGERGSRGADPLFSRLLVQLLEETIAAGEQAILFLNRRGYVPVLYCPGCKETLRCEHCDVGLTFHRRIERLVCHGCCEEKPVPPACPICSRPGLRFLGMGSERVESVLQKLFPEVRVRRMDSDTMRRRADYEEVLGAFERHEVDVLVGTQMIAKGLDFPRVTLVGIVSADPALHLPDFRSAERTFQLIAQVSGRAGRGERPGRIVVQTRSPEHPAIQLGSKADFTRFAQGESRLRAELGYPPHGRLVRIVFEDESLERVEELADLVGRELGVLAEARGLSILGPAPAPLSLLRGRHRVHLLLKARLDDEGFGDVVRWLADRAATESRVRVKVDVDPVSML